METVLIAEPPARWAVRPKLVVDASLVAASVFSEKASARADAQMQGRNLCAPTLIDYEIANVALSKVRQRGISAADSLRMLALYAEIDIARFDVDLLSMLRIGESFGLSAYDAAYLWVAGELHAPIATFDASLAAAAKTYLSQLGPSE